MKNYKIEVETNKEGEIIELTKILEERLSRSNLKNGIANIFVQGSTAALTVIENEKGLLKDFYSMLERLAPSSIIYEHEKAYHDGNGRSHVRASLLGPDLAIPFIDARLALGTWQSVVLIELDIRPRRRSLIVQFMGE